MPEVGRQSFSLRRLSRRPWPGWGTRWNIHPAAIGAARSRRPRPSCRIALAAGSSPHQRIAFFRRRGRAVGDDSQLMLNLQTTAEQLATYCPGRAWVFMSQEERGITKQMNERRSTDFSKIRALRDQGGACRPRSRRDRRRLADEERSWVPELDAWRASARASRRSSVFPEGTKEHDNYLTRDSFVAKYRLWDYQLEMFTQAMRGLSGITTSSRAVTVGGARSLPGVCQQIAQERRMRRQHG